jgi:hypothetical protein
LFEALNGLKIAVDAQIIKNSKCSKMKVFCGTNGHAIGNWSRTNNMHWMQPQ